MYLCDLTDNYLIQEVKALKQNKKVKYATLAQSLDIKPHSFYNWIAGKYELSDRKKILLYKIIRRLKE